MGYATAAAVGGKFAAPDRPVVALVGDGAHDERYGSGQARRLQYTVIWVVMDNAKLGMAYDIQNWWESRILWPAISAR